MKRSHPTGNAEAGPVRIHIQLAADAGVHPDRARLRRWIRAALGPRIRTELTVRIVGESESAALNSRYRGKDRPTNVLSFPAAEDWPEVDGELRPLGDLVVCAPVVEREARAQHKPADAHWAHIVMHGALHLVGYDHETDADARQMEAEERRLLARFGYADPYAEPPDRPD